MSKPKILVLGGGDSPEREISLLSSAAVAKALKKAGFEVSQKDPKDGLNFIKDIRSNTIVFPILHGVGGEDGEVQKELEKHKIPFLGSGSESSRNCFDKWLTRQILEQNDILMAPASYVSHAEYLEHEMASRPHVLKTIDGGSSIGTYIVRNPSDASSSEIKNIFANTEKAIVEELAEGIEITVPILDKKALPVIEIKPPQNEEFDYENKYNGATQEICPPQNVNETKQKQVQEISEKVHRVMQCRHFSRVDLIIRPDGSMVVLEINTIPGMTDQSLFPLSAKQYGLNMPDLMKQFVNLVVRDYQI